MCLGLLLVQSASAALVVGPLDDFDDGTLQGWDPVHGNTAVVAGGPAGSSFFLEVSPAPRLAAHDTGINGTIAPSVTAIQVDLVRPLGQSDLEIRLVLFGPSEFDRWTSTMAEVVPGDRVWRSYWFSIAEADLTQVLDAGGTYVDLVADLDRIMFRFDDGAPDAQGSTPASGTFGIDNVAAVPVPGAAWLFGGALGAFACLQRRRPVQRERNVSATTPFRGAEIESCGGDA